MPQVTLELGAEQLKEIAFQLPPQEFLNFAAEVEQRAETLAMMRLAETGFQEWNEKGEEIYDEGAAR